jgi:RNA polymerase sigma factor (sigma-70 family)
VADFEHPGVVLEQKEMAGVLFKRINELPENQRAAYTLAQVEGLSYQEVAAVMEMSVSAIESLLFRAKQNLKNSLRSYYTSF